jgi:putative DNA primase/helicase
MTTGHDEIDCARSALFALNATCARDEWVRAAMAAKAAGLPEDDFLAWSATGDNYSGVREARSVWRSIKPTGGIGAGTLFHMAGDNGWSDTQAHHNGVQAARMPSPKRTAQAKPQSAQKPSRDLAAMFDGYPLATSDHPYIVAKRGNPDELRVVPADDPLMIQGKRVAGWLAVPVRSLDGALQTIQYIPAPDGGKKLNAAGASFGNGLLVVGDVGTDGTVYVCEGIGQAWACAKADYRAAAVVAFGSGRVRTVAKLLRERYPVTRIVIVPDKGKEADAEAIAREVGGAWVELPADKPTNYDANDYERDHDSDTLADLLRAVKTPPMRLQDGVILVNGSDLKPEPVRWLWDGWLAMGKLHILAGAPGQGKTTIAIGFAATVTSGGRWPDGSRCTPGNVLIWSGEDDPADTLLPRLLAAGADASRVFFVTGARVNGELDSFDPSRDMLALHEQAERIGNVRLIIVDPIVSAVTGDSHKNTETRRALQPLVDLAAAMNAALVGITHFSKGGQGGDPTQRVVGSIAFTAVARVVLVAARVKSEEGEDRRILARSKSNIGPDEGGFEYHLEQSEPLPGIHASYVAWGASVAGSARELLSDPNEQDDDESSALEAAADFLRQVLGADVVPSKSVEAEARDAGIAWRTVRRASDSLGVKKRRGDGGKWYWSLTKSGNLSTHLAEVVHPENMDKLDNMDNLTDEGGIERQA